jgi:hypothetical protein
MGHNPQILQCGHTFEASTIRDIRQQAAEAVRNHHRGYLPTVPRCPSCRVEISSNYVPVPNVNLRQAVETIGERVLSTLQNEQMQKNVYREALPQAVQDIAQVVIERNTRITNLEGENGALRTENGGLRERVQTTEQRNQRLEETATRKTNALNTATNAFDQLCKEKTEGDIELGERDVNDLSADISSLQTTYLSKRVGEMGFVAGLPAVYIPSMLAAATVVGPVGILGVTAVTLVGGFKMCHKITSSITETKAVKTQKEQEKLNLEDRVEGLKNELRNMQPSSFEV